MSKYMNYKAKVFGLLQNRDQEISKLNDEIEKASIRIAELEKQISNTSVTGDFDSFKKNRAELSELVDLKQAYKDRIGYLSSHPPIADDEVSEIKSAIENGIGKTDAEAIAKIKKILPSLMEVQEEYKKDDAEIREVLSVWDSLVSADQRVTVFRKSIGNTLRILIAEIEKL